MDIVANSLKTFPVGTAQDFLGLLTAASESGPGAASPTKIEQFVATHPSVPKAGASVQTPTSFAKETYNGVNAFVFVAANGTRQPFRYRIEPDGGAEHLDKDQAAAKAPDFLVKELPERMGKGPVVFHLKAQLAEPGDPLNDATMAWPDGRRVVDLGTISLDRTVADSAAAEKSLLFLPLNLVDGVEPSDDPLIQLRNDAYAVSFGRRS